MRWIVCIGMALNISSPTELSLLNLIFAFPFHIRKCFSGSTHLRMDVRRRHALFLHVMNYATKHFKEVRLHVASRATAPTTILTYRSDVTYLELTLDRRAVVRNGAAIHFIARDENIRSHLIHLAKDMRVFIRCSVEWPGDKRISARTIADGSSYGRKKIA